MRFFVHNQLFWAVSAIALLVLLGLTLFGVTKAQSPSPITELEGYAWSSTIGWISMNCSNESTCAADVVDGHDYKVEIMDDFTLSGYGWSEHIGWVKFGGLSSCPGGSCDAVVNTTTNELEGWARACAGTDPGDCTSMADHIDGWDGWISLNCANTGDCATKSNYMVKVTTGGFAGCNSSTQSCAWGSDVVGWVDWGGVTFMPPYTPGYYACEHSPEERKHQDQWGNNDYDTPCDDGQVCDDDTYTCVDLSNPVVNDFSASPEILRSGATTTISWDVSDVSDCTVSGGKDMWTGSSSSEVSSPLRNLTTYTLWCTPADGVSDDTKLGELNVQVVPSAQEF